MFQKEPVADVGAGRSSEGSDESINSSLEPCIRGWLQQPPHGLRLKDLEFKQAFQVRSSSLGAEWKVICRITAHGSGGGTLAFLIWVPPSGAAKVLFAKRAKDLTGRR